MLVLAVVPFVPALGQDGPAPSPQREFTAPVPLLDADGSLAAWGWARRAVMQYNREAIPPERHARVKEWEHYTVMSPDFTLGVTLVQLGSVLAGSAELIDYNAATNTNGTFITTTPKEKSFLPADPYGASRLAKGGNLVAMRYADGRRTIEFRLAKTKVSAAIEGRLELVDDPRGESVAITRPFAEPGQFFYENKIFGMPARGAVTVEGRAYTLPEGQSWAIFDWGRGIWPAESQWFWGQAAGTVGSRPVAFNLGHGYGDDARGTCNAILYEGKLHKLANVACRFDEADRMRPWTFTASDDRLSLDFTPIYEQHTKQDLGFARAELFKIHGHYSGTLVLDDGTRLEIKDVLGFAEHMAQKW